MQQIMCFHMRDIRRELVLRGAIHSGFAADENDGEPDVGKTADNLVHPGRYAAPDIRIRTLKQQADVRRRFFR